MVNLFSSRVVAQVVGAPHRTRVLLTKRGRARAPLMTPFDIIVIVLNLFTVCVP